MSLVDLRLGPYLETLAGVECDAIITDPPYSATTHKWHNDGTAQANRLQDHLDRVKRRAAAGDVNPHRIIRKKTKSVATLERDQKLAERKGADRRTLPYSAWSPADIATFYEWAATACRGWIVAMCDHNQFPVYQAEAKRHGRYAFGPVVVYQPGSRVRMTGDGPAVWCVWVAVSRPKHAPFNRWGALPGGYLDTASGAERGCEQYVSGKSVQLMTDLVRDYSRPGDLVCDPCAGWGTTLLAARNEGRRAIGSELDAGTHARAVERLARPWTPRLFDDPPGVQTSILGTDDTPQP